MKLCVLDFETGGLNPATDALMSVALVKLHEDLTEASREYYVIKDEPGKIVTEKAVEINGITPEVLEAEGVPVEDVLAILKRTLEEGYSFVCHNAPFDIAWLNERAGVKVTHAVDTLSLARMVWPRAGNKLWMVCERMRIEVKDAHNSLGDVLMTAEVLREFKKHEEKIRFGPGWMNPQPIRFYS